MVPAPFRFDPDLSPEEFQKLGQLSLRWSNIEHTIGNCLRVMLRLSPKEAAAMVFPLTLDLRLQKITQIAKINPQSDLTRYVIDELKLIMPAIQYVRNNVVHAVVADHPHEGHMFILRSKERYLTKTEIFSAEELTNYAAHVTLALRYAVGVENDPERRHTLPERPEIPAFLLSAYPALRNPRKALP